VGILSLLVNDSIGYVEQGGFNTCASPTSLDGMLLEPNKRKRSKREVGRKETKKKIRMNTF
jgi:hypothetical protein